jgi:hypothetical protein
MEVEVGFKEVKLSRYHHAGATGRGDTAPTHY